MFGNVCDSVLPASHIGLLIGSEDVYSRIVLEFQAYNRLFIYAGHTNTRINTPMTQQQTQAKRHQCGKNLLLCTQTEQRWKKDFGDHIYIRIKLGFTAWFSGTLWHVGAGNRRPSSDQCSVPEKSGTQQKGCAATQRSEWPSSDGEEDVLGGITFTQSHSGIVPLWRCLKKCSLFAVNVFLFWKIYLWQLEQNEQLTFGKPGE